jgi:hypothetical protein
MSWRKRPFFVRKPGCSVAFTRPRHRSGDPNDCRRCLHLFVVFPARRRNYLTAVIRAGFSGIILGRHRRPFANMTAVSKVHPRRRRPASSCRWCLTSLSTLPTRRPLAFCQVTSIKTRTARTGISASAAGLAAAGVAAAGSSRFELGTPERAELFRRL